MGLGIYPVFSPPLSGDRFRVTGEQLATHFETLNEIATSARLTPITAFSDTRPVPDDFDGHPEELDEVLGEWTEWFDPSEGCVAIQALVTHIKADPNLANRFDVSDGLLSELEELARVLSVAKSVGVRFRLKMS